MTVRSYQRWKWKLREGRVKGSYDGKIEGRGEGIGNVLDEGKSEGKGNVIDYRGEERGEG